MNSLRSNTTHCKNCIRVVIIIDNLFVYTYSRISWMNTMINNNFLFKSWFCAFLHTLYYLNYYRVSDQIYQFHRRCTTWWADGGHWKEIWQQWTPFKKPWTMYAWLTYMNRTLRTVRGSGGDRWRITWVSTGSVIICSWWPIIYQ